MEQDDYIFSRDTETARLEEQGRQWASATRPILERVGLGPGMTCLDVGCGPGQVMRLMGEMVGSSGKVVGVDVDGETGRAAIEHLNRTVNSNFSFVECNLSDPSPLPEGLFDLTFGRLILIHVPDPVAVLRSMYSATKIGGYVVVQDANMVTADIQPRPVTWPSFEKLLRGVLERSGKDAYIGTKLPLHFVNGGLGPPDGTEVYGRVGWLEEVALWTRTTLRSLMPAAHKLGLLTKAEGDECLAELEEMLKHKQRYVFSLGLLVSAWKRRTA
ncbi:MAG: class I SAM-dependent methyltransferase [Alphaproteobacteria bacterium]